MSLNNFYIKAIPSNSSILFEINFYHEINYWHFISKIVRAAQRAVEASGQAARVMPASAAGDRWAAARADALGRKPVWLRMVLRAGNGRGCGQFAEPGTGVRT
jgi:hypothetical protein